MASFPLIIHLFLSFYLSFILSIDLSLKQRFYDAGGASFVDVGGARAPHFYLVSRLWSYHLYFTFSTPHFFSNIL